MLIPIRNKGKIKDNDINIIGVSSLKEALNKVF
jgi:hypothetical protein